MMVGHGERYLGSAVEGWLAAEQEVMSFRSRESGWADIRQCSQARW